MPTVLDLFGLKFIIFTADHQPPHCHVKSSNGGAKFIIKDKVELVESTLKPRELKLAEYILEENLENIQNAWKNIHGEFLTILRKEARMKVKDLWFADNRIYVKTEEGEVLYQSLYFYPRLLDATDRQRAAYEIWDFGIRWDEIDEDMSFESFYYDDTKAPAPGIQSLFLLHPELNVSAVARRMGIAQSLLASYIKGTKKPSKEREESIVDTVRQIGRELSSVR